MSYSKTILYFLSLQGGGQEGNGVLTCNDNMKPIPTPALEGEGYYRSLRKDKWVYV